MAVSTTKTSATKKKYTSWITTNCGCLKKDKKSPNALNQLSEETLKLLAAVIAGDKEYRKLKANTQRVLTANAEENADGEEGVDAIDIAGLADFLGVAEDPKADPIGFTESLRAKVTAILDRLGGPSSTAEPAPEVMAELNESEEEETANTDETNNGETPTDNVVCPRGCELSMPEEESGSVGGDRFVARNSSNNKTNSRLTPEEQEDIAFARKQKVKQKATVANRLVAHITDNKKRLAKFKGLMAKSYSQLMELNDLIPNNSPQQVTNSQFEGMEFFQGVGTGNEGVGVSRLGNFFGAAGGVNNTGNTGGNSGKVPGMNDLSMDDEDILPLPHIEWGKKQAE